MHSHQTRTFLCLKFLCRWDVYFNSPPSSRTSCSSKLRSLKAVNNRTRQTTPSFERKYGRLLNLNFLRKSIWTMCRLLKIHPRLIQLKQIRLHAKCTERPLFHPPSHQTERRTLTIRPNVRRNHRNSRWRYLIYGRSILIKKRITDWTLTWKNLERRKVIKMML